MNKEVKLTELVDTGTNLRVKFTPKAQITDKKLITSESGAEEYIDSDIQIGKFWDVNTLKNIIIAGAKTYTNLKLSEDKLNNHENRIISIESLIGSNNDDIINRFNEIVDFLNGIGDTETLLNIINNINDIIDTKANKSDVYTKNEIDDAMEAISSAESMWEDYTPLI